MRIDARAASTASALRPLDLAPRAVWEQLARQAGIGAPDIAASLDHGEHTPMMAALVEWLGQTVLAVAWARRALETGAGFQITVGPDGQCGPAMCAVVSDAVTAALLGDGPERAGAPWWQDVAPYASAGFDAAYLSGSLFDAPAPTHAARSGRGRVRP
jgi:hypothetical protein